MENGRPARMNSEPRERSDYNDRQIEAARRVLVDLGQVLGPFKDCFVIVGGWIPELLIPQNEETHVGSIDVDIALNIKRLNDGRYADLLKSLLNTKRYRQSEQPFRLVAEVDLEDGGPPIQVDIDFLKPPHPRTQKNNPKLTRGFRPLDATGCQAAFENPQRIDISGRMIKGQCNKVTHAVSSIADFLIMKSYALANRDKPKDAYDICYCLDYYPDGIGELALNWRRRKENKDVSNSIKILEEKFSAVDAYGPQQVVEFHNSPHPEERDAQARRAYELVQEFLRQVQQ